MQIVHTNGRKSLPTDQWVKAEASQGASNCVAALLAGRTGVSVGDTQTRDVIGQLPATEWAALVAAVS
ncbi:DUF397 domain-containing protein [Nocardiopsis lucentensis]|uniref:DUF397 domain-containing protein n=1 Tax=Nocardiopsis lucentensis TaxID=53441 RepID=UPI000347D21B|nr:DUF397 domain-containing protein [Nocardiopsis lucentensis]